MDVQQIANIAAKLGAGVHATPLALACTEFGVDTDLKLAHFLSQLLVESVTFTRVEESLNYSVDALLRTFSRQRISAEDCARYGRVRGRRANQVMIANLVYGGMWGRQYLGNIYGGDGWKYRGHGLAQITGRHNTSQCSLALFGDERLEDDPDLLFDPMTSARAAGWYWQAAKVWQHGDDVISVTRAWNGGLNGIDARTAALKRAKQLLGLPA